MNIRLLTMLAAASLFFSAPAPAADASKAPEGKAAEATKAPEGKAAEAKTAAPKTPAIKLYDQTMTVAPDWSSEVRGKIQLTNVAAGAIEVPLAPWGDITDFTLTGAETKGAPNTKAANPRLALVLPADAGDAVEVQFSFKIPAPKPPAPAKDAKGGDAEKAVESNYKFISHRFMNGTTLPVERYRLQVWLPEDVVVHTVPEALPKAGAKDTKSRVQLVGKDGRQGAVLEIANLRFGATTSMRLETEPAKRNLTLLWIGILLSLLYMFYFRDVLNPQQASATGAEVARDPHHTHKEHE